MQKITRKVEVYVTSDGMTFGTESQAQYHEQALIDHEIEKSLVHMELKLEHIYTDVLDGKWTLVSNETQREYLTRKYVDKRNYHYLNGSDNSTLQLGDWVAIRYEQDSYGEKSRDGIITLSFLIEKMQEFIAYANEVTVDGRY